MGRKYHQSCALKFLHCTHSPVQQNSAITIILLFVLSLLLLSLFIYFLYVCGGAYIAQASGVGVHQAHVRLQDPKSAHHIKQMYKTL